ncbi:hypothetical protein SeMB42_g04740 [Synchytrium endobioticum]|uniref:Uncharacterized protein n=1 Tax=Synchytrium endobioticum TaxID=286115 RepID=A0A507CW50_9FUNG|nr:hypothetical protein SeMB42_g04740 [Synchytrium endobioticum]
MIWMVIGVWRHFLVNKKQRLDSWPTLLSLGILTSPLTLIVVCIAAVLDAPLVPIFGLPFFWISFPRIARFWSFSISESPPSADSTLYSSLAPPLLKELSPIKKD